MGKGDSKEKKDSDGIHVLQLVSHGLEAVHHNRKLKEAH